MGHVYVIIAGYAHITYPTAFQWRAVGHIKLRPACIANEKLLSIHREFLVLLRMMLWVGTGLSTLGCAAPTTAYKFYSLIQTPP